MLRLDRLARWASGNKYFKLKYPLKHALENGYTALVSKGGPFSNHLDALALACAHFGLKLTCLVRSYTPLVANPTLDRLRAAGAQLVFLSPERYASFDESESHRQFPGALFIPEGGLHPDGIMGAAEIASLLPAHQPCQVILAGGSMCTALGLLTRIPGTTTLNIIPAWKGCTLDDFTKLLYSYSLHPGAPFNLWPDFHFGGFGRWTGELFDFMIAFTGATGIALDPVYTGKMMYALTSLLQRQQLDPEVPVIAIHTGGQQGIGGFAYRYPDPWQAYLEMTRS